MRISIIGLVLAVSGVATSSHAQDPPADGVIVEKLEEAGTLLQERRIDEAQPLLEQILAWDPTNGLAWNQLGYCLLSRGDREGALEAYERAAENGFDEATVWYNLACVNALLNRPDEALDWLDRSLRAGFYNPELVERDPDLVSIRDHPRFKEIYTPAVYEPHPMARPVTFTTDDSLLVDAELYPAVIDGQPRTSLDVDVPLILLFHQAGSNAAEYQLIAPRLCGMGFQCLALDARGGGRSWGRDNVTMERFREKTGQPGRREDALQDFSAAIAYVRDQGYTEKIIVWGSSYSASLVFDLVVTAPEEFAAGLAYSPGRRWARAGEDGGPSLAERVTVPMYVMWPPNEFTEDSRADFETIATPHKVLFVPDTGRHGSSTLRSDRNPEGYEENWASVEAFLDMHGL